MLRQEHDCRHGQEHLRHHCRPGHAFYELQIRFATGGTSPASRLLSEAAAREWVAKNHPDAEEVIRRADCNPCLSFGLQPRSCSGEIRKGGQADGHAFSPAKATSGGTLTQREPRSSRDHLPRRTAAI